MYQGGDRVVYGSSGVCIIMEICTPNFTRAERGKQYYKLRPITGSEVIYAPVDTNAFMRPVMTKSEAEAFVARIPHIEAQLCSSHSVTVLRQQYEEFFRARDCEGYVKLIKGVREKSLQKKLGQTDQRYMKRAEDTLHSELAVALEIPPDQVGAYIRSVIGE